MTKRRTVRWVMVAAAAAASVALSACTASSSGTGDTGGSSTSTGGATASSGGVLKVAFTTSTSSLDPAFSCANEDRQLTDSLYVRLTQFGSKAGVDGATQADYTKVEPFLAKSWVSSNGGKTYTFTLQDGWTFPDGKPVDAAAVAYSLNRTLTMNQCGATILNDLYSKPNLISKVSAVGDKVEIDMTRADPQVLSALADASGGIVEQSIVEANGGVQANKTNDWMSSHAAGSGPYTLASYTAGSSAVLKANPTYKGPKPASSEIDITWTTSASTALINAKSGSSDVTFGLSGASLESLSGSDVDVQAYNGTESMLMTMPNDKAPWTNEKVREAVVKALPIDDILKNIVHGYGTTYYGPIPPTMPGYSDQYGQPIKTDLAAAKQLMAASGVKTPVSITLDIVSGDDTQKSIATVVQSTLKQIGINVTVSTLTSSAWSDAVYNGKSQSALRLDGPAVINAGYYLAYDEACDSAYNTGHICIPANTALLNTARSASTASASDAAFAELSKNWVAAYPRVTFYVDKTPVAVNKSVKSFYYQQDPDMSTWSK